MSCLSASMMCYLCHPLLRTSCEEGRSACSAWMLTMQKGHLYLCSRLFLRHTLCSTCPQVMITDQSSFPCSRSSFDPHISRQTPHLSVGCNAMVASRVVTVKRCTPRRAPWLHQMSCSEHRPIKMRGASMLSSWVVAILLYTEAIGCPWWCAASC